MIEKTLLGYNFNHFVNIGIIRFKLICTFCMSWDIRLENLDHPGSVETLGIYALKILIILGVLRLLVYLTVLRVYIRFESLTSIQYFTIVQITFI